MIRAISASTLAVFILIGLVSLYGRYQLQKVAGKCPAPGEFVSVQQSTLHYIQREGGEVPVVFLHGASSNSQEWQYSLFGHLPEKYKLIAIDRPGLGHSEREKDLTTLHEQVQFIHQAIQVLELIRPVLVVHSLSGVIGARLLTDYPDNYRGLVIVAGATYPIGDGSSWYTRLATLPGLGHIFRYAIVPVVGPFVSPEIVKKSFAPQPVVEGYIEKSCMELLYFPDRFLANSEDLNRIRSYLDESYPLYTSIKAPVSLIYGDNDQVLAQFTHAGGFKYQVPHARYIMLPNLGHLPHYFHQSIIAEELDRISSATTVHVGAAFDGYSNDILPYE